MSMHIYPSTTTHTYVQDRECLHIIASPQSLRVRWMREGVWILRWDASFSNEGYYTHKMLCGELADNLDQEDLEEPIAFLLLQALHEASLRLPLYENPDIIQELSWFILD